MAFLFGQYVQTRYFQFRRLPFGAGRAERMRSAARRPYKGVYFRYFRKLPPQMISMGYAPTSALPRYFRSYFRNIYFRK
jgi:hypothetical protein